jgi:hypothetical protein
MFRKIAFGAIVAMGSVALAAPDAKDDVTAAAKKLADASNYSWKQTTESGQFNTSQEGKTEKDGFTTINLVLGDNTIQTAMKGKKAAVKLEDGWKSTEELANADQQGPGRFIGGMVANFKSPGAQGEEYAAKLKDVKKDGDAYTSQLTGADAAALAPRRGRRGGGGGQPPQMQNAKLEIKMWVKDGVLTKYTSHVTGTMTVNGEDRDIDATTTTEISDVGSTKVEVPDEAKKKLE